MAPDDLRGVLFILAGMFLFSFQDVLIRELSDDGSLLQILSIRGSLGAIIILLYMKITGRRVTFGSSYPWLALTRVILFFTGFLCFYFALSGMPLAEATSLFFASPLFITLLSKYFQKVEIGIYRTGAIIFGFIGVLFIVKPSPEKLNWISLLPLFTAFTYAISMLIARMTKDKDSIFQQMIHLYIGSAILGISTSALFSFLGINENSIENAGYLLRGWNLSNLEVVSIMIIVATIGSIGMLLLTSAYRLGSPPVIAPFEYSLLILAVSWGYLFFGEIPDYLSIIGMGLIVGSSLFIFIRESIRKKPLAIKTSLRT
ncbi:MAG: DMT family transporter [Alphaproteobacteria bacterium]|nr:DMT family transporter [Alphaproteobacteria bacterium]